MSVLPDSEIARELHYGDLDVDPVDLTEQLQPASLDIRLGYKYRKPEIGKEKEIHPEDGITIVPGEFYLINTYEEFDIPDYLLGEITGRSSVGRLGITIHQTAGLFDPGFQGDGLLEVANVSNEPETLYPEQRVGQMVFKRLTSPANEPYNSERNKYQGQKGAVSSKIDEDDDF